VRGLLCINFFIYILKLMFLCFFGRMEMAEI
jgi:hypothetical protein